MTMQCQEKLFDRRECWNSPNWVREIQPGRFAFYCTHHMRAFHKSESCLRLHLLHPLKAMPCPGRLHFLDDILYCPEISKAWCAECGQEILYEHVQRELDRKEARKKRRSNVAARCETVTDEAQQKLF